MYLVRTAPPSRRATAIYYAKIAWPWVTWMAWGAGKILLATMLAYLCCIFLLAGVVGSVWRGPR